MVKEREEKAEEGSKRIVRISCEDINPEADHEAHECTPIEVEVDVSSPARDEKACDDNMIRVIIKATDRGQYVNEESAD